MLLVSIKGTFIDTSNIKCFQTVLEGAFLLIQISLNMFLDFFCMAPLLIRGLLNVLYW